MVLTKRRLDNFVQLDHVEWWWDLGWAAQALWNEANASEHVSLSPIQVVLEFDPDPESFPASIKMLMNLSIEIES